MTYPIPEPSRPVVKDYGIPEDREGLLSWKHVDERMAASRNYWIATTRPDGRPHAVPVWGVWLEETLYFGGGPDTRWSRNLAARPEVAVHLESGDDVVILEGRVERIIDPETIGPIDDAYEVKYDMRHGPPIWILRPRLVLAWTEFPRTMTRWQFQDSHR